MTKVLVTGGAGFIGSHTVDALLARGYEVRILDAFEPPVHDGSVPAYVPREVEVLRGRVEDATALRRALEGVQIVYHIAAYQDYLPDFSKFFLVNSCGTALLFELIVRDRLPVELVVVASSQSVYGEGKYTRADGSVTYPRPRDEEALQQGRWDIVDPANGNALTPLWSDEAVVNPHNAYALSKWDQEAIGLTLGRRYGIPTVAFRYSIVQGPRQSFRNAYSGALRSFVVRLLNKAAPVVYEDGRQLRDYVAVEDVVQANLLPLDHPEMAYEVYNVGGDRCLTVLELADLVVDVVGHRIMPEMPGLYRVGDMRHARSEVNKVKALGWRPNTTQRAIVEDYVRWAAEQPGLRDTFAEAQERMLKLGVLRPASGRRG